MMIKFFLGFLLFVLFNSVSIFTFLQKTTENATYSLNTFCLNDRAKLPYESRHKFPDNTELTYYLLTNSSFKFFPFSKFFFSCRVLPSFRFVSLKLKQNFTSNDINLWKKETLATIKIYMKYELQEIWISRYSKRN